MTIVVSFAVEYLTPASHNPFEKAYPAVRRSTRDAVKVPSSCRDYEVKSSHASNTIVGTAGHLQRHWEGERFDVVREPSLLDTYGYVVKDEGDRSRE